MNTDLKAVCVSHMAKQQYEDVIDHIKDQYEDKALAFLKRCKAVLDEAGFATGEPFDMHSDTYQWKLIVNPNDDDKSIDITLEISEALEYGDSVNYPFGISFGLMIVEYGGLIRGQFQPFNYTPQCWVDGLDDVAVEQRWQYFDSADLSELPELCKERDDG